MYASSKGRNFAPMTQTLNIVFFGTPGFAACSLKAIAGAGYHIAAVVTAPDKPAGRGMQLQQSEVKKAALELHLPVLQPANLKSPGFLEQLRNLKPDLGVVIAFRMLPMAVWDMPRLGTFNLHASLLPQYRGAAPINHAIINGETETGVTTFFLKHEIDTGDIVLQQKVAIAPEDNAGTLHDKLMLTGADLVLQTLALTSAGSWPSQPQQVTENLKPAPKIHPDFCVLSAEMGATEAHNKIRGLSPYPGAWLPDQSMKVLKSEVLNPVPDDSLYIGATGLIADSSRKKLCWAFADGILELLEVQPKGKKRMESREYLNGLANKS